jgi:serine/threonine-protein kinase RsbW
LAVLNSFAAWVTALFCRVNCWVECVDPQNSQLTVAGYFKNLSEVSQFIGQAASRAGLNERAIYAVRMAVDEACTNIIQHAYGGEGRGQIQLVCETQAEGLRVTIYDQGRSFEPLQVPDLDPQAPLPKRQPGGMGLFFIRNLMDTVEFKFGTPQGNQLILFKRRESTS